MEWWHVYLFTRLDVVHTMAITLMVIGLILGVISGACWLYTDANTKDIQGGETWRKGWEPWRKGYQVAFIATSTMFLISLAGLIAIPTQKEAAAIYLLPKLAHSDFAKEAQQIPTDAAKLMRLKLEQWIADMEPAKANK